MLAAKTASQTSPAYQCHGVPVRASGPVDGAGQVAVRAHDPYADDAKLDSHKLLYTALIVFLIGWLCCGCSGVIYGIKAWLLPAL